VDPNVEKLKLEERVVDAVMEKPWLQMTQIPPHSWERICAEVEEQGVMDRNNTVCYRLRSLSMVFFSIVGIILPAAELFSTSIITGSSAPHWIAPMLLAIL
jgi:hypothetical protein